MCGYNNDKMNPNPEQPKNHLQKNEKVIQIKIFKFTLKLTNWKKLEKKDYAALFVATMICIFIAWIAAFIPTVLLLVYFYPPTAFFILLYYIRIYLANETPDENIKPSKEEKFPKVWNLFRIASDYFPIRLIKTADLPADRNYILACYPHGILPLHTVPNFSTNLNNKDKLFPGISIQIAAHNMMLSIPFVREFYLKIINACSCSASTLKHILNSKPSRAVVLYPGGMSEICLSGKSKTYRIIKSRRKGFIRIALQTGASLVPVFNFGEINMYTTYPLRGIGKPTFGLDVITIRGRGYFQHHFGFIPHDVPINTVVGKPISVPKVENPSSELIDEYHENFFHALQRLFDKHKGKYDIASENARLVMM